MRLATKGSLLLLTTLIVQGCIGIGLILIRCETNLYRTRVNRNIEKIDLLSDYLLDDFSALANVHDNFAHKLPVSPQAGACYASMKDRERRFKELDASSSSRISVIPQVSNLKSGYAATGSKFPSLFGLIDDTTQRAYLLAGKVGAAPEERTREFYAITEAFAKLAEGVRELVEIRSAPLKRLDELNRYQKLLSAASIIDLVAVLCIFLTTSRRIRTSLTTLIENVEGFRRGKESGGVVSGDDEITKIDSAIKRLFANFQETMFPQKLMMEYSQDLICLLDVDGHILSVSRSCISLVGYSPEELIGTSFSAHIATEMQSLIVDKLKQVSSGQEVHSFESRVVRDDKVEVDVLVSVSWSASEQMFFCVVHDITQRIAAERLQQEFMQMVSHDLKSPLNAISNFHELLESGAYGEFQPKVIEQVRRAQRSTERMLTLVNDLLDIERMGAGLLELEKEVVEIDELIESSKESLEGLAQSKAVSLEYSPTHLRAYVDRRRLIQVIVNLLSNAIKFSERDKQIFISAAHDHNCLILSIKDEGRGIPLQLQSVIFDRFTQTKSTDATTRDGSGLGLSICKALIELHGGTLSVSSEVGQGSTFRIHVPGPEEPIQEA